MNFQVAYVLKSCWIIFDYWRKYCFNFIESNFIVLISLQIFDAIAIYGILSLLTVSNERGSQ